MRKMSGLFTTVLLMSLTACSSDEAVKDEIKSTELVESTEILENVNDVEMNLEENTVNVVKELKQVSGDLSILTINDFNLKFGLTTIEGLFNSSLSDSFHETEDFCVKKLSDSFCDFYGLRIGECSSPVFLMNLNLNKFTLDSRPWTLDDFKVVYGDDFIVKDSTYVWETDDYILAVEDFVDLEVTILNKNVLKNYIADYHKSLISYLESVKLKEIDSKNNLICDSSHLMSLETVDGVKIDLGKTKLSDIDDIYPTFGVFNLNGLNMRPSSNLTFLGKSVVPMNTLNDDILITGIGYSRESGICPIDFINNMTFESLKEQYGEPYDRDGSYIWENEEVVLQVVMNEDASDISEVYITTPDSVMINLLDAFINILDNENSDELFISPVEYNYYMSKSDEELLDLFIGAYSVKNNISSNKDLELNEVNELELNIDVSSLNMDGVEGDFNKVTVQGYDIEFAKSNISDILYDSPFEYDLDESEIACVKTIGESFEDFEIHGLSIANDIDLVYKVTVDSSNLFLNGINYKSIDDFKQVFGEPYKTDDETTGESYYFETDDLLIKAYEFISLDEVSILNKEALKQLIPMYKNYLSNLSNSLIIKNNSYNNLSNENLNYTLLGQNIALGKSMYSEFLDTDNYNNYGTFGWGKQNTRNFVDENGDTVFDLIGIKDNFGNEMIYSIKNVIKEDSDCLIEEFKGETLSSLISKYGEPKREGYYYVWNNAVLDLRVLAEDDRLTEIVVSTLSNSYFDVMNTDLDFEKPLIDYYLSLSDDELYNMILENF